MDRNVTAKFRDKFEVIYGLDHMIPNDVLT
jgi:hypothetical protein